jgi:hypothetical protein
MKLEDMSAPLRKDSVADGRQIFPFPSLLQAIEDCVWRDASI